MVMNFEKLIGLATQPADCKMRVERAWGVYYVSLEMTDHPLGSLYQTSLMFRNPNEVTDFLAKLESTVSKARQEFSAHLDQIEAKPESECHDGISSLVPADNSKTHSLSDGLSAMFLEEDLRENVSVEVGRGVEGFFTEIKVGNYVVGFIGRTLDFETKKELFLFLDSIIETVEDASLRVEEDESRLERAGISGNH